jgi:hypothetical protein
MKSTRLLSRKWSGLRLLENNKSATSPRHARCLVTSALSPRSVAPVWASVTQYLGASPERSRRDGLNPVQELDRNDPSNPTANLLTNRKREALADHRLVSQSLGRYCYLRDSAPETDPNDKARTNAAEVAPKAHGLSHRHRNLQRAGQWTCDACRRSCRTCAERVSTDAAAGHDSLRPRLAKRSAIWPRILRSQPSHVLDQCCGLVTIGCGYRCWACCMGKVNVAWVLTQRRSKPWPA